MRSENKDIQNYNNFDGYAGCLSFLHEGINVIIISVYEQIEYVHIYRLGYMFIYLIDVR